MKVNARDVIYYPHRLFENNDCVGQELGTFFLKHICSHVVVPKKHINVKTGVTEYSLKTVPLYEYNLNSSDLGLSSEIGDINDPYIGEMEVDARKVGELVFRRRFFHSSVHDDKNMTDIQLLDTFKELGPDMELPHEDQKIWAMVRLEDKMCIRHVNGMFDEIASSDKRTYTLDYSNEFLEHLRQKGWAKRMEDFDLNRCTYLGKFSPVWRVNLTL